MSGACVDGTHFPWPRPFAPPNVVAIDSDGGRPLFLGVWGAGGKRCVKFRRIDPASARIVLIKAGPRIMSTLPANLSDYVRHRWLRSAGCGSLTLLPRPARSRNRACVQPIEFLKLLDASYPAHTAIKLILDNHSAHISKETKTWLAEQPVGRFEFTFTPTHGSWLNLIEGFFSKLTRSVLRHIRVASKQELKDRIMAAMDEFNRHPVVHTWSYKLDRAA